MSEDERKEESGKIIKDDMNQSGEIDSKTFYDHVVSKLHFGALLRADQKKQHFANFSFVGKTLVTLALYFSSTYIWYV